MKRINLAQGECAFAMRLLESSTNGPCSCFADSGMRYETITKVGFGDERILVTIKQELNSNSRYVE